MLPPFFSFLRLRRFLFLDFFALADERNVVTSQTNTPELKETILCSKCHVESHNLSHLSQKSAGLLVLLACPHARATLPRLLLLLLLLLPKKAVTSRTGMKEI